MEKLHYRISLDMFETVSQKTIKAKKGDTACDITITLTENGKVYQIAGGCNAKFSAKKPDGSPLYNSCSIENNTITYGFTEQTTSCEGMVECEVILYDEDGNRLTSPRFSLLVGGTVYNKGEEIVDSAPEADALKELIGEASDVINEGKNLLPEANAYAEEIANQKKSEAVHDSNSYTDEKIAEAKKDITEISNLNFANAIKGNESGYAVAIRDVSPIEHNVKVKLLSETATDFTKVKCEALGKNVLPTWTMAETTQNGLNFKRNKDGSIVLNGTTSTGYGIISLPFPILRRGMSYTVNMPRSKSTSFGNGGLMIKIADKDGNETLYKDVDTRRNFTFNEGDKIISAGIQVEKGKTLDNVIVYPQIEIGETVTEYEPYIKPVQYTPNADGTVDGVVSIYPSMTIQTDTDGVIVETEYNKDTNKVVEKLMQAIISLGGNV